MTGAGGSSCVASNCPCPAGQMSCTDAGVACVTTASDPGNCGVCGNACGNTQTCSNSMCSSAGCVAGTTNCSGACVDLSSDNSNCRMSGSTCTGVTVVKNSTALH